MKTKERKVKVAKWYNNIDWQWVGGIFALLFLVSLPFGLSMIDSYEKKDKTQAERLKFEEFSHNGHQYFLIKEGDGVLDDFCVVHNPDCNCQNLKHHIN